MESKEYRLKLQDSVGRSIKKTAEDSELIKSLEVRDNIFESYAMAKYNRDKCVAEESIQWELFKL